MKKQKTKNTGAKAIGNRTVIGIVCIVAALAICFGIAPLVNRLNDGKTEIVRICQTVIKGSQIGEGDVETVKVGAYNLPAGVLTKRKTWWANMPPATSIPESIFSPPGSPRM